MKLSTALCVSTLLTSLVVSPVFAAGVEKDKKTNLPIEDLRRFTTVVEQIRSYYITPKDDKTLFEYAIRGMLAGLDPHSTYMDPEEFKDLKVNTSGKFGGLGIEVTMEDGLIKIISPIDDSPAARAGVKAGDLIVRLDETPVKGMPLKDAVEKMRGAPGSPIKLTLFRKGVNEPIILTLKREIIKSKSVKSELMAKEFGYVRVAQFQLDTGTEVVKAVKSLQSSAPDKKLKGLILDLRNNPGGIVEASVEMADAFLDRAKLKHEGLIVYTEGRLAASAIREAAHNGDIMNGAPIIVLINGGSASASEIVAGALQDHQRAIILGENSFGKGSVQTVLPLQSQYGLKLTTALYYTPAGRSIQAKGIKPDIFVAPMKVSPFEGQEDWDPIRESDLSHHLANGDHGEAKVDESLAPTAAPVPAPEAATPAKPGDKPAEGQTPAKNVSLSEKDYQLNEALNLLKGLTLVQAKS